jgi:hypothetical protein
MAAAPGVDFEGRTAVMATALPRDPGRTEPGLRPPAGVDDGG